MKKIYITALFLLGFLVVPLDSGASAPGFKDVGSTHWAYKEISFLSSKGIVQGYTNGRFGVNDSITVTQGMLMVERVVKKKVPSPVKGGDGKKSLTRGEVAILLDGAFDFNTGAVFPFYDLEQTSPYLKAIHNLTSNHIAFGYPDGSYRPEEPVTRAQFSALLARVLDTQFRKVDVMVPTVKQRILVKSTSLNKAQVQLQELDGANWKNVQTYEAVIGKNGTGKTKEGDGKTPIGAYSLGTAFGWGEALPNLQYPFKRVTSNDYWIDDVKSKDYNKWVTYSGNPSQRWNSFERMNHPLYKYGVVIRYNEDPIIAGKGSAIFLHMKNSTTKYTLGCIALNEQDLITLIKWLNKDKNPKMIIS